MKILYWMPFFSPDPGGIETAALALLPELVRRGCDVTVVASHGRFELPDLTHFEGIPVHRFHFRGVVGGADVKGLVALRARVKALKAAVRPDVVHINVSDPSGFFHLSTRDAHPSPTILTLHQNVDFYALRTDDTSLLGKIVTMADWVTTCSRATMQVLARQAPRIAGHASVIYNGIAPVGREPGPLPFAPPHLLFVGRLIERKGVDVLLEAFARVRAERPDARLSIAGDGVERAALEERARALGLGDAARFLGAVEAARVPELLDSATCLVLAARAEGLPMVVLEAAQMARPVVATDVDGIPEAVVSGETGLLVPADDVPALTAALLTLLSDPERAAAMGAAARARIERSFAVEAVAAQLTDLYAKVRETWKEKHA